MKHLWGVLVLSHIGTHDLAYMLSLSGVAKKVAVSDSSTTWRLQSLSGATHTPTVSAFLPASQAFWTSSHEHRWSSHLPRQTPLIRESIKNMLSSPNLVNDISGSMDFFWHDLPSLSKCQTQRKGLAHPDSEKRGKSFNNISVLESNSKLCIKSECGVGGATV